MGKFAWVVAFALGVASAVAAPLKAALYVDRGCRGSGVIYWAEILRDAPDVDLRLVDGADIRGGALDDRELLVMPGGDGKPQYEALGDEGAERIRRFVADGGKYFGTCCGFSIALNEDRKDRKRLKMLPFANIRGNVRGGFTAEVDFTPRGAEWLGVKPGVHRIRYHNGPVVQMTKPVPNCAEVEVLATMKCELAQHGKVEGPMFGTPAVVRARYGKGAMLVFNCHPEMFPKSRFIVAAGVRALTGREVRIVERPLKPRGAERVGYFTGKLGSKRAVEGYFALRADPAVDVVPITQDQLDEEWRGRFDRIVKPEPQPTKTKGGSK